MRTPRLALAIAVLPLCVCFADDGPVTKTSLKLAASDVGGLPTEQDALAGTVIPGVGGVLAGGFAEGAPVATVRVFNPHTEEWSSLPDIPRPRGRACAAWFEDKLWVIGGADDKGTVKHVDVLNIESKEWSEGPELPRKLADARAIVYEGRLLVIGGNDGNRACKEVTELMFNKKNERKWDDVADLAQARSLHGVCHWDGGGLLVAGGHDGKQALASCELLFSSKGAKVSALPKPASPVLAARLGYPDPALMLVTSSAGWEWRSGVWLATADWPEDSGEPVLGVGGMILMCAGKAVSALAWSGRFRSTLSKNIEGDGGPCDLLWLKSKGAMLMAVGEKRMDLIHPDSLAVIESLEFPHSIAALCLSLDGKHVAAASQDGSVSILAAETLKVASSFKIDASEVRSICYNAAGTQLAIMTKYVAWVVGVNGEVVAKFDGHRSRIRSVSFSPDGRHLATLEHGDGIRVFSIGTGERVQQFKTEGDVNNGERAIFVSNELILTGGQREGAIYLHQWKEPKLMWKGAVGLDSSVSELTLLGEGSLVGAINKSAFVVFRVLDGQVVVRVESRNPEFNKDELAVDEFNRRVVLMGGKRSAEAYAFQVEE